MRDNEQTKEALAKMEAGELLTMTEVNMLPDGEYEIDEFTSVSVEGTSCRWTTRYRAFPAS